MKIWKPLHSNFTQKKKSLYISNVCKSQYLKLNGHNNTFGNFQKRKWIPQVLTLEIALQYKLLERLLFSFWKVGASPWNSFFNMLCTHYFLIIKKTRKFSRFEKNLNKNTYLLFQKVTPFQWRPPNANMGHDNNANGCWSHTNHSVQQK